MGLFYWLYHSLYFEVTLYWKSISWVTNCHPCRWLCTVCILLLCRGWQQLGFRTGTMESSRESQSLQNKHQNVNELLQNEPRLCCSSMCLVRHRLAQNTSSSRDSGLHRSRSIVLQLEHTVDLSQRSQYAGEAIWYSIYTFCVWINPINFSGITAIRSVNEGEIFNIDFNFGGWWLL